MDAKRLAESLADDLIGSGLIGEGSKGQYIRWMLGKVRGNRKTEKYRAPHGFDRHRKPKYAGWSPEDWDGKYTPFDPSKVKSNRSKFIQTLVKQRSVPEEHERTRDAPSNEELAKMTFRELAGLLSRLNGKPPVIHAKNKATLITRINKELEKQK